MVAAGYIAVGEFHYAHHRPDGDALPRPQRDGASDRRRRATTAGIEIVLLMTAYAARRRGPAADPRPAPVLRPRRSAVLPGAGRRAGAGAPRRVGLAPHSVRAVPRDWLEEIAALRRARAAWSSTSTPTSSGARSTSAWPSTACGRSSCSADDRRARPAHDASSTPPTPPTRELDLLALAGASVCACPTTEANLGDGFLPALRAVRARHAASASAPTRTPIIDPVVELREIEALRAPPGRAPKRARAGRGRRAHAATCSRSAAETAHARSASAILPGEVEIDLDHPLLAGVAAADAAAALIFGGSAAALRPIPKG